MEPTPSARKQPTRSRAWGDTVAAVTDAMGIPKCGGCAKRQAALNRAHAAYQAAPTLVSGVVAAVRAVGQV